MGIGKNIYNNIEIYNYLNMKQNIDLTFCAQQALDSFSSFFSQKISSYRRNTSFTKDLPISVSLKYDTVKKKQANWTKTSSSGNISFKSSM